MSKLSHCLSIILAGGAGTRMSSSIPKVLMSVEDDSMLSMVVKEHRAAGIKNIVIVKGHLPEMIEDEANRLRSLYSDIEIFTSYQKDRLGTADAVSSAREYLLNDNFLDVLVSNGDTPLVKHQDIIASYAKYKENEADALLFTMNTENPFGYGRIIKNDEGFVTAIKEHKDLDENEANITECNAGIYWFNREKLLSSLDKVDNNNKAQEYYLTDTIKIISSENGKIIDYDEANPNSLLGANTKEELEHLASILKSGI